MARSIRIQYAGAHYHVMAQEDTRKLQTKQHRRLSEAVTKGLARRDAAPTTDLLLETPAANLVEHASALFHLAS